MCDQATEAGGLVPPLQSLTKLASLRRLFLAQQPLAMELPLASPASCELRSVIRFLAAKKKSAKEIHEELCQVYGEECMSSILSLPNRRPRRSPCRAAIGFRRNNCQSRSGNA
ncbi:hypothetical protein TNCV_219461 [Trichonephila clavipes]|nr:hypothetical protein TNCV_219461 [Trichonephila clavipes]